MKSSHKGKVQSQLLGKAHIGGMFGQSPRAPIEEDKGKLAKDSARANSRKSQVAMNIHVTVPMNKLSIVALHLQTGGKQRERRYEMPGRCRFYIWQRAYLKELVDKGFVEVHGIHGGGMAGVDELYGEGEADSSAVHCTTMEMKIDSLIRVVKALMFMVVAIVVVGMVYLMK
ncbi:hypothetical protein BS78_03G268100 [Paspalum vaginatum]|nr:hypothetical protein BS78_03G268100 [Paspalum vaginatum]